MQEKTLDQLVDAATIIFKGTVRALAASLMPEISANEGVGVVTVDTVMAAAPALGDLAGTALTMRFTETEKIKVGDEMIFFTNAWVYGTHLGVSEAGRIEVGRDADVVASINARPDRQLAGHIAGVELVVAGVVEKVAPASDVHEPVSFHSPQWKIATVRAESVKKGKITGDRLDVLFASSNDVMWASAPKPHEAQKGVFLVHRGKGMFAPPESFTVIDLSDVQPIDALSRITKLI